MNEIYSQQHPENLDLPSIFLAGPSPRKEGDYNWRPEAMKILHDKGFKGNMFIPLPKDGKWPIDYEDQVQWELKYLNAASTIIFWIPRDITSLPGFTTNVEFGMFLKSGKIVLGYPKEAEKMKYLNTVAEMNNVPIRGDLVETIETALEKMK